MPATADSQIHGRLKQLREQAADLRRRRTEAIKERDSAKSAFAGTNFAEDVKITETAEFKAAEVAVKAVADLDEEITSHKAAEDALLGLLGEQPDPGANGNGRHASLELPRSGWDGRRLLRESDAYSEARSRGLFTSTGHFGVIELGEIAGRDEAADFLRGGVFGAALPAATPGAVGSPGGLVVPPDFRGIVPPRLLSLSLLDLIPAGTTDSNVVHYVQVTAIPGSAAETAEMAVKPQEGITFADASANVVTIAGWIKVARQALDDMAGLGTIINQQLPYDVRRRVLTQLLIGDGVGNNLRGIINTTGVGAPAATPGDTTADALLRLLTVVVLSDSDPNFVLLNPIDWQGLLLLKNAQGNYIYGTPGQLPGGMVAQTIWGMTLTTSRVIPAKQVLVGDTSGVTLLVREGVNVKTSDSDQDDFLRNRVTVLAETRVALPVWRPSAFAIGTLP